MSDKQVGVRYFNTKIPKTVSESGYQECLNRQKRAEGATKRGNLHLAVDLLRQNLIWCKTNLSTDPMHEMVVWHQEELAACLAQLGNFNDALVHIGDAYDSRHAVSPDAESTLATLDQYAFILSQLKRFGLAARKYETVWKAQQATLGEHDPLTLNTGVELASCWFNHAMAGNSKTANLRKARDLHQEVLKAMEKETTPDGIAIAMAREDLARDHMELGNLETALKLANKNLTELRRLGMSRSDSIKTEETKETETSTMSLRDDIQNRQNKQKGELLEQEQKEAAKRDQESRDREVRRQERQQREQELEEQRIKEKRFEEERIKEQQLLNEALQLEKLEKEEVEKARREQERQVQIKRELEIKEQARIKLEKEVKKLAHEAEQKRLEQVNLARLKREEEIKAHWKKRREEREASERREEQARMVQLKIELEIKEQAKKRLERLDSVGVDLLRPASATGGKPSAEDPDTKEVRRRVSMPDMTAKSAASTSSTSSGGNLGNDPNSHAVSITSSSTQPASREPGAKGDSNDDNKKPTPRIGTPTIKIDGPLSTQSSNHVQPGPTGNLEGKPAKQISRSLSTSKLGGSSKLETSKQSDEDGQRPRRNSDPSNEVRSPITTREPTRRSQPAQAGSPFDAIEERFADRSVDGWFHDIYAINEYILAPFRRKAQKRVKIAILDTGIDMNNSVFQDKEVRKRIKKRVDFVDKGGDATDICGHGTHCAGLLSRIAPSADIYIGRVAVGFEKGPDADVVAEAIRRALGPKGEGDAADNWDVDIISLSLGFNGYNRAVKAALDETIGRGNGKLVLAAASNSGTLRNMAFPASAMGIIAVNSATANGMPSGFNPRSTKDEKRLSILGEAISSAWITTSPDGETIANTDATRRMTGTSVATPIAAGIVALILEVAMIDIPDEEDTQRMLDEVLPWLRGYEGMMAVLMDKAALTQGYHNIVPQKLLNPNWSEERRVNRIANRLRDILTEHFGDLRDGP